MAKQATVKKANPETTPGFYDKYIKDREFYYLILLVLLGCYVIFSDFISLKKVFLFKDIGSDTINMEHPMLIAYSEYIKHYGVPTWSFSQGMGQNIFPLWLGDISYNFVMLFDKDTIPKMIAFMEILKIFLMSIIFFKYLKELKLTGFAALLGALLYSFSGYVVLGGTWTIFSTEALYVAILLLGFERWLQKGKWFLFMLGITLIGLLQPFYLFSYTLYLVAYILVRYNDVHGNLKGLIPFGLKTVGIGALGVAISAYQLLPDILMLLESPRVGGEAGLSARLKAQPMFELADKVLRFTTTFRSFGSDMLGVGNKFQGWQNYLEAPMFYCGILSLVSFPHVFTGLSKRQKIFYGVLLFMFALPILFPYFRYAFWVFSGDYFRTFCLVIVLLMVFFTSKAISSIQTSGKINKIVLGATALALLLLLYTPDAKFKGAIDNNLRSIAALLVVAYSALLFFLSSGAKVHAVAKLLLVIVCYIEILVFSSPTINKRDAMYSRELTERIGYNDYTVDAVKLIKSKDQSFFRVHKDFSSGLAIHGSMNDAKAQGFYGTTSYHSFNQKNYIKFLGDFNIIDVKDENSTRWAKGLLERPILFSLASGKYWLTKRTDNYLRNFGYDSIAQQGDVKVFKNRYALPFGFTYDKVIALPAFKKISSSQKDIVALHAVVADSADMADYKQFGAFNPADTLVPFSFESYGKNIADLRKDSLTVTSFEENHITGKINLEKPKVLFFSIPFDEGWSAKVNGADARLYRVNSGFTGLILEKGQHNVELMFKPRLKNTGKTISLLAILVAVSLAGFNFYRSKKRKTEQNL